jgi:hypothetical protein
MVINMTTQPYLIINNNVVENVCLWDGNPNTWQPPINSIQLVQSTTPALVWVLNADQTDYVLEQVMGVGQIGFIWNGTVLTTNQPKPPAPTKE